MIAPEPRANGEAGLEPMRRLSPLTPLAKSGLLLAAVGFGLFREEFRADNQLGILALIAGSVIVSGLALGFVSWWRTGYRISETELRIDSGLFSRRSRKVRLDRILEIGINQPFVARILGLAELQVESATGDVEVKLAFVRSGEAHELRELLLAQRDQLLATEATPEAARASDGSGAAQPLAGEPLAGEAPGVAPTPGPVEVLHVPIRWQVTGWLASWEVVLLALAAMVAVVLLIMDVSLGLLGPSVAGVVGSALSLARKVTDWWGWRIHRVPAGLQVKHGLLNVATRTFNVDRLQGVRVIQTPLHRMVGMARLDLVVTGSGSKSGDDDEGSGAVIPVAPVHVVWRLAVEVLGTDPRELPLQAPPRRANWFRPLFAGGELFGLDERFVVQRRGRLGRRHSVVVLPRVQSFALASGPFQRWLRVATVIAHCPGGLSRVSGPHWEPGRAREMAILGADLARTARQV